MTRYDQVGFTARTPAGSFNPHDDAMTATGSTPSRTVSWDAPIDPAGVTGDPSGIAIPLDQAGGHKTGSSTVPGQVDPSVIIPLEASQITSTGASGSADLADHWSRKSGQQLPSGGTA